MKIRLGFVSNSSSSSFICKICGVKQSGMDMTRREAGMTECENNHIFCEDHLLRDVTLKDKYDCLIRIYEPIKDRDWNKEVWKELMEIDVNNLDESEEILENNELFVPREVCPICQFEVLDDEDVKKYMYKKFNINDDQLKKEIKKKYSNYNDFIKDLAYISGDRCFPGFIKDLA